MTVTRMVVLIPGKARDVLAMSHGMWALISPTRVEPASLALEAWSLSYWPAKEAPRADF